MNNKEGGGGSAIGWFLYPRNDLRTTSVNNWTYLSEWRLSDHSKRNKSNWISRIHGIQEAGLSPLPADKVFRPKHSLTVLESYKDPAPSWYWHSFPSNFKWPAKSMVDPQVLKTLARECSLNNALLDTICDDLTHGANIGCVGTFRSPSISANAPSSFEFGPHVSDAIADWIHKGFAYGPITLGEVPKNAKINGIMCKQKPNGSVRIILNLSSPEGLSVNEGIDEKDFPATMSSTLKWIRVLNRAGRNCRMTKVDWSDAYKHLAVRVEDLNLQWFSWLGMAFCELCLIFGSKSSVGLYDRLAKQVLAIVCAKSGMPSYMVCQHLDDCVAAAPEDSELIYSFDNCYYEVADQLGIRLAPRDDPEKAFGPSTSGVVFGVHYDTVNWTWSIPAEKLCRILHNIEEATTSLTISQGLMMSICGKILDVRPLVPGGRFHVHHIIRAAGVSQNKNDVCTMNNPLKGQLEFWSLMLRVCSGAVNIPDPDAGIPPWAWEVFTDASGGGLDANGLRSGRGIGAVAAGWWAYVPWSRTICRGPLMADGRRLNRKMSALELIGPLLVVSAGFNQCLGRPVRVWVDNAGSVGIWKKGYSTNCELCTTIVLATATIAAGLGCWLEVSKISRCSNAGADMADALSKADFGRFWATNNSEGFNCSLEPSWVPVNLLAWLESPCVDEGLGARILGEIGLRADLL